MGGNQLKKILLVDGMALLFRAFYATSVYGQYMKTSSGVPTNGIHGFLKHLLTAVQKIQPTHVIACWDMGSTTFRTEVFSQYKANRGEAPAELKPQFSLVKEATSMLQIPNIGLVGYEADDCIGTLSKLYDQDGEVFVLTGDTDLLQLSDHSTTIMLMRKGVGNYSFYTPDDIFSEKGVQPWQIVHAKAFMGDTSDNYPGVRGIGEKTAYKLIQQFQSVQGVLDNLHVLSNVQRIKIESDMDNLMLSLHLAKIQCDLPISCELEQASVTMDTNKLSRICTELEWNRPQSLLTLL